MSMITIWNRIAKYLPPVKRCGVCEGHHAAWHTRWSSWGWVGAKCL